MSSLPSTRAEHRLILASKSKSRAAVLRAAGLQFEQIGSGVDEDALKDGAARRRRQRRQAGGFAG